eukprot:9629750-Ditylum_brightwellii.AAC.1
MSVGGAGMGGPGSGAGTQQVRSGDYDRGNIVKVQSIEETLATVSKTIKLAGQQSPIYKKEEKYILLLK